MTWKSRSLGILKVSLARLKEQSTLAIYIIKQEEWQNNMPLNMDMNTCLSIEAKLPG